MLKYPLTHPEILAALAGAGHGSHVVIADANFPASTRRGRNAALVHLNLAPGVMSATEVLKVLLSAIEIEAASVMQPEKGPEPPIFEEFRAILPKKLSLHHLNRQEFYAAASGDGVCLTIATGEKRLYGNLLLTIGVVTSK